jgi:ABC-type nickel/cobalt efflux system permease component RcnA
MMARALPSRWRFAFFVASALALTLPTSSAFAHPVPRRCHDRTIIVRLTAAAAVVHYRLDVDYLTIIYDDLPAFGDEIDLPKLTTKEAVHEAFLRCYAPVLAQRLNARLDGKRLEFACADKAYRLADDDGKPLDHLRFDFVFKAPWQLQAAERHEFSFREDNFQLEEGRVFLSLEGEAAVELMNLSVPDRTLQERPSRELRPGDDARLRQASASFRVSGGTGSVATNLAAKPASDGVSPGASGRQNLLELLLDPNRGFWILLLLAGGFGAVHALTPGHGKTLVAAYLVGEQGTAWHALVLGLVTTVTHTGAVLVLAALLLYFFPDTVPARVQAALGVFGGLLVAGMGFWLLLRRLAGGADHVHLGSGGHHHSHVHALPTGGQRVNTWGLIVLGISGGIVPCWDAIAMLGFAISAHRLWLALPLLVAFSAGLAAVLIVIGIGVVYLKGFASSRWGTGRLVRALPLVSASLVMVLGLWLCYDSVNQEPEAIPAAAAAERP